MGLMVVCGDQDLPAGKNSLSHDPDNPNMLQCSNTTIAGKDGDTVILPCSTKDKMDLSLEQVEWFFEDPPGEYKTVHVYFQHKDYLQKQSKDFRNRTSLFKEGLSSGNCSLRLKGTTSHSGRYFCSVPGYQRCTVTLKVLEAGKNNPHHKGR
ncbi:butyrophilin subfamily 3 member A2-like [Pagrus major]|uniref:butyrophilin subfamily 3 member A2-like n=1 Tax=Pagrus major TaxID=143350 RepID=UPI003CC8A317